MEDSSTVIRVLSFLTFVYLLSLIHNHKLRIGYSWFLFLLATGLLLLSVWPKSLLLLSYITGTPSLITNLLFLFVLFLLAVTVHTSLINTHLTTRVKELSQEITLLKSDLEDMSFPFNGMAGDRLTLVHRLRSPDLSDQSPGPFNPSHS